MYFLQKVLSILKMLGLFLTYYITLIIITVLISFFYGAAGLHPPSPQAKMLIAGVLSMGMIFLIGLVLCKIYKINLRELGMTSTKYGWKNYGKGVLIGFGSIVFIWIVSSVLGGFKIQVNTINQEVLTSVFFNLLTMLMVGYYEEWLTRGFMAFVNRKNNRVFNAVMIGIIFSCMHLLNPSFNIISMINTLLVAVIFSMLTWITGDLWIAIGYHFFWNFTMSSILGVPVSGIEVQGLLISAPSAQTLINGGGYGLEASLVCTIVFAIQIWFLYAFFLQKGKVNKEPAVLWLAKSTESISITKK